VSTQDSARKGGFTRTELSLKKNHVSSGQTGTNFGAHVDSCSLVCKKRLN
jgi:hypothetical protein